MFVKRGCHMILDGRALAATARAELAGRVASLQARGTRPGLRILLIGEDAPSRVYVRNKERAAAQAGIECLVERLPVSTSSNDARRLIQGWNQDPAVHGIIVQLPVPAGLDGDALVAAVDPKKDVDGLSPASLGALAAGRPTFMPATPSGIIELLVRNGITIPGKHVVILGRGGLVGKPLALMLLLHGDRGDATVTVCHTKTRDLAALCRSAGILVSAVGKPHVVTSDMVSDGAVVVDAGTSEVDGHIVGDVDFAAVEPKAAATTPVPGGVGPMTVAMLLANVVRAAEQEKS